MPSGEAARLRANAAAQKSWELNANQQVTFAIFREAQAPMPNTIDTPMHTHRLKRKPQAQNPKP